MADWRSLYPFADHACDIGGYRYHFVDEGSGEQPIVCVHGNPTWSFYYRRIVSEFRNSQRVLAVDHIGCGLSDKPQRYPYTLQQHTQNLIQWLDHLDLEQVVMVVHDWGGAIGLGAALARPERIAKLLILNTGAFPPPYVPCVLRFVDSLGLEVGPFDRSTLSLVRLPLWPSIACLALNLMFRQDCCIPTEMLMIVSRSTALSETFR